MKAVLVSRYPRVDTPAWKQRVAEELVAAGCEVHVLYSRSSLTDQARAGLREDGLGVVRRYLSLRRGGTSAGEEAPKSLATWARERGLGVHCCRRLGDEAILAAMQELQPDLFLLAGADIAPPPLLAIPRLGTINAHYGLLPAYRGMNVTEWSLWHGDPVGVTVHLADAGIDTGDILEREEIPVQPGDDPASLRAKHQQTAARLMVRAALALLDGTAHRRPQQPHEGRQFYRMHPALRRVVEARLAAHAVEVSDLR